MDIVASVVVLIASSLGQTRNVLSWGHSEANNDCRRADQKIKTLEKAEKEKVAVVAEGVLDPHIVLSISQLSHCSFVHFACPGPV